MVWFRRSTWFQCAHRNEQAAGASTPELLLVSFGSPLRTSKEETCENNCRMARACVLSKQVSLRPAALGCVLAQDWHTGNLQNLGVSSSFLQAVQQRYVFVRYWEGATAYRGYSTSQRRGEFKAGQISFAHDGRLVPYSPIFQSLCPANRLCSPPSSSLILYLHIAPSQNPPPVQAAVLGAPSSLFAERSILCSSSSCFASYIP